MGIELEFIARVRSPYVEKFAIPRQPGLAPGIRSRIELIGEYAQADCLQGLEQCSHIWLQFIFHESQDTPWRPKVRPPRLGGNRSMGVFATRSPVRPNPIGLSVAKIESIDFQNPAIEVSGLDLLDQTPILDIKPYVPYADAITAAHNDFATEPPAKLDVSFSVHAANALEELADDSLKEIITQLLAQDPRPAYQRGQASDREYGVKLRPLSSEESFNIRWVYRATEGGLEQISVFSIERI